MKLVALFIDRANFASTAQPGTQSVSGRVGEASHRAIFLALICLQKSDTTKEN